MIRNILVPLDGTELATSAREYAQLIATLSGANLSLLSVVHATLEHGSTAEAEAHRSPVAVTPTRLGLNVATSVDDYDRGRAAGCILKEVEATNADLIVMASHGRLGHNRWAHGSITEHVVHACTVPVLLAGAQHAELLVHRLAMPNPVLIVPLDGTPLAEAAVPFAKDLAEVLGARLRLVEVLQFDRRPGLEDDNVLFRGLCQEEELERECAAYLEAIGNLVAGGTPDIETEVCFGDVARCVSDVTNEYAAAAVVMATHGRTGLARSIQGSVAGNVMRHTNAPVVLIGPRALRPPLRAQRVANASDLSI